MYKSIHLSPHHPSSDMLKLEPIKLAKHLTHHQEKFQSFITTPFQQFFGNKIWELLFESLFVQLLVVDIERDQSILTLNW